MGGQTYEADATVPKPLEAPIALGAGGTRQLKLPERTAILIACKNGEATIGNTVRSVGAQADVYVVSDGSDDRTVEEAQDAGARVLDRQMSGGKPDALRAGNLTFRLAESYDYIGVLDDDTTIEPEYVEKIVAKMNADPNIAAASGRIDSVWSHRRRWNVLIAMRAFMYWSYQTTMKRGQNAFKVVNVICGANTVFRADVFGALIQEDAPYAIDDMFWVAEIIRRRLGRVAYVHEAHSWTIDPHRFVDWYRQTVRWSWGQFQSIRGHRLGNPISRDPQARFGLRVSWFDTAYLAVLLDWAPYMLEPLLIPFIAFFLSGWIDPIWFLVYYLGMSYLWITIAALALRRPRLVILAPAIMVLDLVYRVTMMHALVKAILRPTIDTCKWDSPTRFEQEEAASDSSQAA